MAKEQIGHTCFGTDINCLGTYTSIHFNILIRKPCAELCDLGNAALDKLLAASAWGCSLSVLERESRIKMTRTRIHGHDKKQIGKLPDFIRYRSRGRVGGNGYPSLHASLVDGVDEGDRIRCIAVSRRDVG